MMHTLHAPAGTATAVRAGSAVLAVPENAPSRGPVTAGTSLIVVLVLAFLLWRALEKKRARWSHTLMAFTMGVLLAGSMLGVMAQQTAASIGQGFATMFSTVTSGTGGGSNP